MDNDPNADRLAALYPDDLPRDQSPAQTTPVPAAPHTHAADTKRVAPGEAKDASVLHYPEDKPVGETADGASEPLFGPPATAYSLSMPEGLQMSAEIVKEFEPVVRELNLSNAGANKLLPLAATFRDRLHKGNVEEHGRIAAGWAREARADPDIGRGNWAETSTLMSHALKAGAADREFLDLIEQSKIGNHPAMIRFLRNVGRNLRKAG